MNAPNHANKLRFVGRLSSTGDGSPLPNEVMAVALLNPSRSRGLLYYL